VLVPTAAGYQLRKSLDGYGNYSADVLYADGSQVGTWTFSVPQGAVTSAAISLTDLGGNGAVPVSQTFTIWLNGCIYPGGPLQQAMPLVGPFDDWMAQGPWPV
jgi:hypothetical protein